MRRRQIAWILILVVDVGQIAWAREPQHRRYRVFSTGLLQKAVPFYRPQSVAAAHVRR